MSCGFVVVPPTVPSPYDSSCSQGYGSDKKYANIIHRKRRHVSKEDSRHLQCQISRRKAFHTKCVPLYARSNQPRDDSFQFENDKSIEALYKLAMEEDEEWFNTFIKDTFIEDRDDDDNYDDDYDGRNKQLYVESQQPGISMETQRMEHDLVDKMWNVSKADKSTSMQQPSNSKAGTNIHDASIPRPISESIDQETISNSFQVPDKVENTLKTTNTLHRLNEEWKDDQTPSIARPSKEEAVIKEKDDNIRDQQQLPKEEIQSHPLHQNKESQDHKTNAPIHDKVSTPNNTVNIPIQHKESIVQDTYQGATTTAAAAPTTTNTEDYTDLIVEFRDIYDPTQWVRESFTKFQYLGYEPKDILTLRPNALDFILEDNIPKPTMGLPKRWIQSMDESQKGIPQVRILKRRNKATRDESITSSTKTRESSRRKKEFQRSVYTKEEEEDEEEIVEKDKEYSFMADAKDRRDRKLPRSRKAMTQDDYDTISSSITRQNKFWMDLPTFKKYLRKEAKLRLSILGSDWKDWVQGESDWRYQLYKSWLEVLDGGIGDDIFEDVPSSSKSKYVRATYRKRNTSRPAAEEENESWDSKTRYRDSLEEDNRNRQQKSTTFRRNPDDETFKSRRMSRDDDDDDAYTGREDLDDDNEDDYSRPKRRRRREQRPRRPREGI